MSNTREHDTQKKPVSNEEECAHDMVCRDTQQRKEHGARKYGTPLQPFNGRNSLQDAYEESLDKSVYLYNATVEMQEIRERLTALRKAYNDYLASPYDPRTCSYFTTMNIVWDEVGKTIDLADRLLGKGNANDNEGVAEAAR